MEHQSFDHAVLRVQIVSSDGLFKALRSHDVTQSQVWREIERLGCGLVPRGRNVVRLEICFRLCVFGLNSEARDEVEELTLWVCQRLDADEPSPNTLENADLPANTDPGQWTQPVDDREVPQHFLMNPDELS